MHALTLSLSFAAGFTACITHTLSSASEKVSKRAGERASESVNDFVAVHHVVVVGAAAAFVAGVVMPVRNILTYAYVCMYGGDQ